MNGFANKELVLWVSIIDNCNFKKMNSILILHLFSFRHVKI